VHAGLQLRFDHERFSFPHTVRVALSITASDITKAPERAAYLRMLQYYPACPACRAVDDSGEAIGGCEAGDRLYEEYRRARRGPAAPPEASREENGNAA
jgi:hypothetical protein